MLTAIKDLLLWLFDGLVKIADYIWDAIVRTVSWALEWLSNFIFESLGYFYELIRVKFFPDGIGEGFQWDNVTETALDLQSYWAGINYVFPIGTCMTIAFTGMAGIVAIRSLRWIKSFIPFISG